MKYRQFFQNSRMKPWDGLILFLLILSSFLPLVIFTLQQSPSAPTDQAVAVLRIAGKEVHSFALNEQDKPYTYTYKEADGGYNLIEISGKRIRIKEADCGDLICVQRGWISKKGETIVCLPHQLVIEIQSTTGGDDGELIY